MRKKSSSSFERTSGFPGGSWQENNRFYKLNLRPLFSPDDTPTMWACSRPLFNFAPPVPPQLCALCGAATCCWVDAEFSSGFARGPPATAQAPALIQDGFLSLHFTLSCVFWGNPLFSDSCYFPSSCPEEQQGGESLWWERSVQVFLRATVRRQIQ